MISFHTVFALAFGRCADYMFMFCQKCSTVLSKLKALI